MKYIKNIDNFNFISESILDMKFKIDFGELYNYMIINKNYKKFGFLKKNYNSYVMSLINLLDDYGFVKIYSINMNDDTALIKSTVYLQKVPLEVLIGFDMKEYNIEKDAKKYNL